MDNQKSIQWLIGGLAVIILLSLTAVVGLVYSGSAGKVTLGGTTNYDDLVVDTLVSSTSTVGNTLLSSNYTSELTFTAGTATGTPGSLFSLLNSGTKKVCSLVALDIDTQVEGSMVFSISTSTSASACSSGVCGGLIASTTVATGTTSFINSDDAAGSGMEAFLWPNGTYILGSLASSFSSASSSDYSSAAGEVYVNCFSE